MLFKKPLSPAAASQTHDSVSPALDSVSPASIDAYRDQSAPKRRSTIVPWVFALGGTGVMLFGAFGGQQSATSSELMMLGGSACEAIGIAWLAPAAVRKIFST